jgi:hypothetical protein
VPGLPPRSAGSAGPTWTNPFLDSTFCDAAFPWEMAARSVRSLRSTAASRHNSWTGSELYSAMLWWALLNEPDDDVGREHA